MLGQNRTFSVGGEIQKNRFLQILRFFVFNCEI